jgi:hypothetical protein
VTIRLYFDEDAMWQALVTALRARCIDVQTALEAAMIERADEDHLAFATARTVSSAVLMLGISIASIRATWRSTYRIPASSSLGNSSTLWGSICVVCCA